MWNRAKAGVFLKIRQCFLNFIDFPHFPCIVENTAPGHWILLGRIRDGVREAPVSGAWYLIRRTTLVDR